MKADDSYEGEFGNGKVTMEVALLDEEGNVVSRGSSLAFFSEGNRVKTVLVTVTWTTTDIIAGFDTNTFQFIGDLALDINADNGVETWSQTYDVLPIGTPDISEIVLTSSKQWTLDLNSDLNLDADAKAHGAITPTTYDLVFNLDWTASMYDTFDDFTESESGTLGAQIAVDWAKGFKVSVTLG